MSAVNAGVPLLELPHRQARAILRTRLPMERLTLGGRVPGLDVPPAVVADLS